MKHIIIVAILFSITFADLNISGDARFRPRLDTKEMSESKTSDLYYLYRARLNLRAEIGKKYFLNLKLGTNSIASMTKMGNANPVDLENRDPFIHNSDRPNIDFLEQYFGFNREKTGLWLGAFPIKHNPALDIHFYPHKMVDIPWALYNNSTITGIAGYNTLFKYKLNWFISMDENNTNSSITKRANGFEIIDENTVIDDFETGDDGISYEFNGVEIGDTITIIYPDVASSIKNAYTIGFNTTLNTGPIKITPYILYSLS